MPAIIEKVAGWPFQRLSNAFGELRRADLPSSPLPLPKFRRITLQLKTELPGCLGWTVSLAVSSTEDTWMQQEEAVLSWGPRQSKAAASHKRGCVNIRRVPLEVVGV